MLTADGGKVPSTRRKKKYIQNFILIVPNFNPSWFSAHVNI